MLPTNGVHLPSLTSLRFFAAAGVVLLHTSQTLPAFADADRLFTVGQQGVTFFFVLSGFVLTWTHREGDGARSFYGRRFARVWPLHAVTAVVAGVLLVWTGAKVSLFAIPFVFTLTHAFVPLPSAYTALNAPSWSLSCEAFFYLLFPVAIVWLSRRSRPLLWAVFAFGVIVAATVAVFLTAGPIAELFGQSKQGLIGYTLGFSPPYRFGEFVIGILVGVAVRRGWRSPVSMPAAAGIMVVALVVAAGVLYLAEHPSAPQLASMCMIPFFALLIAAAASSDAEGRETVLWRPWLIRLGQASFALYLVHWIVIHAIDSMAGGLATWVAAVIAIAVSLVLADLAHSYIERPAERRLRRSLGQRRAPSLSS